MGMVMEMGLWTVRDWGSAKGTGLWTARDWGLVMGMVLGLYCHPVSGPVPVPEFCPHILGGSLPPRELQTQRRTVAFRP